MKVYNCECGCIIGINQIKRHKNGKKHQEKMKKMKKIQNNKEEYLEVATSHTNHMSALNQEYAMAIQGFMSGFGINAKEQGATQNIMVRGEQ